MSIIDENEIYQENRYSSEVAYELSKAVHSAMWEDWDLNDLLDKVPHDYAKKIGVKHGIFCSTGTAGLHASLLALGLKPDDEVIVPMMTFIRAVTPLTHLGLIPVLADIDPLTGNLSSDNLKSYLSPKVRALIVVHMWGIPADMSEITRFCKEYNLFLIEDFSHAHFSEHKEGLVGSFGHIAFASLQRKKTFSVGEGGLIVTNSSDIYGRLQEITSPGSFKNSSNYKQFSGFGLNMRMSPFSAIVAKQLLKEADSIIANHIAHQKNFNNILSEYPNYISIPHIPDYVKSATQYGYKPALKERLPSDFTSKINSYKLWKFSNFDYKAIIDSDYWSKYSEYFPFSLGIQPKMLPEYPNFIKYMAGRVSLKLPTINKEYWTDDTRQKWKEAFIQSIR